MFYANIKNVSITYKLISRNFTYASKYFMVASISVIEVGNNSVLLLNNGRIIRYINSRGIVSQGTL